jgi:hypothetical protein
MFLAMGALCAGVALSPGQSKAAGMIVDHSAIAAFASIPSSYFDLVRANRSLFYGHTSHGSQVISGVGMLEDEDNQFASPTFYEVNSDLGSLGDVNWVIPTRTYLNSHAECNVVMWSWCGGMSYNTTQGINVYLDSMSQLEIDYPGVTFVYMTGHLDGTGPTGTLYTGNNQIRDFCRNNGKVLYDFADLESYDPDGVWYPDETDACLWCASWCATHACPECASCAHSHCFNCYQKGKAFWTMMAVLEGWNPVVSVDSAVQPSLPETFSLKQNFPNPFNPVTSIEYSVPTRAHVTIEVFNLLGQHVSMLVDESKLPGIYRTEWDGKDDTGNALSTGAYLYRLKAGNYLETKKMLLMK